MPSLVRMRVAGPHCGLDPSSRLGGEVYEREILRRLPERAVQVRVGLPASRRLVEPLAGVEADSVRPGRGLRWWVAPLAFVPYTVRLLRSGGVDVLRAHSERFVLPSVLLARRLCRSRVPVVVHHHHTDPGWGWLDAVWLRRAHAVVTVSEFSRRQLCALGVPKERIHVISPGLQRRDGVTPGEWPLPAPGPRLLYVGRLIRRKRPELAVGALAELRRRGVSASLVIAGDGPLADRLRRLARRLGVDDVVFWAAPLDDDRKWELLATADVLLMPSRLEGFGLVALEAQSVGLPVVVAEGTATADLIADERSGRVAVATVEAFAGAVQWVTAPERLAALRAGARERAAGFDWDSAADQVAALYRRLAG